MRRSESIRVLQAALEFDDTHDESLSHPGAPVIATALAAGTATGAAGEAVIAAIIAGYEVMARAGMAAGAADVIEHGFHPTALFGGFGAATAAAKLYGLDATEMVQAWGLVLSAAGGSMQFSQDASGTTVKRLHAGYGAQHGTMAAEHARLGIAGPAQAFDGRYGLCALFGLNPQPELLEREAGGPFQIHRISLKPYPLLPAVPFNHRCASRRDGGLHHPGGRNCRDHGRRAGDHGNSAHAAPAAIGHGRPVQPALRAGREHRLWAWPLRGL